MLNTSKPSPQKIRTPAEPDPWAGAEGETQPEQWFALRVRPRHEKTVALTLQHRGLEQFLPLYTQRRRWSDRDKLVELPLFPTYLFCRFAASQKPSLLRIPGVRMIVGRHNGPEPVDESEIEAVRSVVGSGLPACPWAGLPKGQRVRLNQGPLAGCEGILERAKGCDRLVITVSLLLRGVAVEVDRSWVTPLGLRPSVPSVLPTTAARRFGLARRGRFAASG